VACFLQVFSDMSDAIRTDWRLEEVQTATGGCDIIFKHSDQCDLSAGAAETIFDALDSATAGLRLWMLTVQDDRALSNRVAEVFAIAHATPQAIVLRDGTPVEVRSHRRITREWIMHWVNQSRVET
jgi:bacillithiol system protein YtxJ